MGAKKKLATVKKETYKKKKCSYTSTGEYVCNLKKMQKFGGHSKVTKHHDDYGGCGPTTQRSEFVDMLNQPNIMIIMVDVDQQHKDRIWWTC